MWFRSKKRNKLGEVSVSPAKFNKCVCIIYEAVCIYLCREIERESEKEKEKEKAALSLDVLR